MKELKVYFILQSLYYTILWKSHNLNLLYESYFSDNMNKLSDILTQSFREECETFQFAD